MKRYIIFMLIVSACIDAGCKKKATEEERFLSRQLYTDGMRYENLGNRDKAVQRYAGALAKDPANLDARLRLRNMYVQSKEYDRAVSLIEDADRDAAWIRTQCGIVYLAAGKRDKAASSFESAIGKNKKFPTPYYYLGTMAMSRKEYKKAKDFFRSYRSLFKGGAFRESEEDHVRDAEHAVIRIDHPEEADRYLEALKLFQDDSPMKAEKLLAGLSIPPALVLRAKILRCYDKSAAAEALLRKAGGYLPAQEALLEILYAAGDRKRNEARTLAETILKKDAANQHANFYMGKILSDAGKEKEAEPYFNKAARSNEDEIVSLEAKKLLDISDLPAKSLSAGVEQYKKLSKKDSPRLKEYRAMMNRIIAASGRDSSIPIELEIYDDAGRNVNAVSMREPERAFIFISGDLVSFVDGLPVDSELKNSVMACVIGHELCHILDRHSQQAYSMNGVIQGESFIATREERDASTTALNQAQEFEADRTGSMFAYVAGYNPFMLKQLYAEIIRVKGDIPKQKDHPVFRERIVRLDERMVEMKSAYQYFKKGAADLSPRKGENAEAADGRLARAEKSFRVFLSAFPDNGPALNNMGLVCLQKALAGTEKRRLSYATSISINPGLVDPAVLEQKPKMKKRGKGGEPEKPKARAVDRKKLELAAEYFRKASKLSASAVAARNNLGIALAYLGRHGEAKSAFDAVLKAQPDNARALNNLGVCETAMKKTGEGRTHIKKAADRGLPEARANL